MASFEEILNRKASEIKPPQAYPVGTYHCLVDGPLAPGKSSQKQTDLLQAKFKILSPLQDVDAMQAAEQQIVGKYIVNDYYVTDKTDWRIKELCEHCGIDFGTEGAPDEKSLKEGVAELAGKQVLVKLKHEISQDGKRVFHRVESTAHV